MATVVATLVKPLTPAPVIKRSLAFASTVAHVMYQKYVDEQKEPEMLYALTAFIIFLYI